MTTSRLHTLTSTLTTRRARSAGASGRRAARAQRRGAGRGAVAATVNRTGVAGFGHFPDSMPRRTR